jgi:hypothetical protein
MDILMNAAQLMLERKRTSLTDAPIHFDSLKPGAVAVP